MTALETGQVVQPGQRAGIMKSTWWQSPLDTVPKKLIDFIQPHNVDQPTARKGKIPVFTARQQMVYLLPRVLPFFALQYASHELFKFTLHPVLLLLLGSAYFMLLANNTVKLFNRLGQKWSFYDGNAPRDKVPNNKLNHLSVVYNLVVLARNLIGILVVYDRAAPVRMNFYWIFSAFFYTITLDFFFYVYHRSSHEVDALWKIHQTHHLTKHPTPILALLADEEQEILEGLLIPLAATYITKQVMPSFTFHDWYAIQLAVIFGEILGHSGIRAHVEAALTSEFLRPFGADLALEDHDLHHRRGWKKSFNYGKQSRLWDFLFGTMGPRCEAAHDNIDWNLSVFDEVPESE